MNSLTVFALFCIDNLVLSSENEVPLRPERSVVSRDNKGSYRNNNNNNRLDLKDKLLFGDSKLQSSSIYCSS